MKALGNWKASCKPPLITLGFLGILSPVWADGNGARSTPHQLTAKLSSGGVEAPKGAIESTPTVIKQVQATEVGQSVQVRVIGTGALSCNPFRLPHPDRLVLDCAGARVQAPLGATVVDLDLVHAVRAAQFKPDVARIVIDLRADSPYTLRTDENTLIVSIETTKGHEPGFTEQSHAMGSPGLLKSVGEAMDSGNSPAALVKAPPLVDPAIAPPPNEGESPLFSDRPANPSSTVMESLLDSQALSGVSAQTHVGEEIPRLLERAQTESAKPSTALKPAPSGVGSTDSSHTEKAPPPAGASVGKFGPPVRDEDYVIGPEDVLAINVWHEAELSRSVPVRPDGKISLPLVGDVKASGLTANQLEVELANGLDAYIHKPQVTVIVEEVNSHKFYVLGEVQRPGSYPLSPNMTVLSALAVAGGFRDFAKVSQIYVLRLWPDGTRGHIRFDYKAAVNGSNSYRDLELKTGDTVVVP